MPTPSNLFPGPPAFPLCCGLSTSDRRSGVAEDRVRGSSVSCPHPWRTEPSSCSQRRVALPPSSLACMHYSLNLGPVSAHGLRTCNSRRAARRLPIPTDVLLERGRPYQIHCARKYCVLHVPLGRRCSKTHTLCPLGRW